MGLADVSARFLFYAKKRGVSFERSLMLGRQDLYCKRERIRALAEEFGVGAQVVDQTAFPDKYSEPLFRILGASVTDSMDFSDYEKANVIHDLNQPVPDSLKGKYTALVDGGTLEHVFNFPVAISNCMQMLAVGGHFIALTPANNQLGHGFYQFSPELYYRVLSAANGFRVKQMLVVTAGRTETDWYEVADPEQVRSRVTLTNTRPVDLFVLAEKIADTPIFERPPQQSDYQLTWNTTESLQTNVKPQEISTAKFYYRKIVPMPIKNFIGNTMNLFKKPKELNEALGEINPDHFKKFTF